MHVVSNGIRVLQPVTYLTTCCVIFPTRVSYSIHILVTKRDESGPGWVQPKTLIVWIMVIFYTCQGDFPIPVLLQG